MGENFCRDIQGIDYKQNKIDLLFKKCDLL